MEVPIGFLGKLWSFLCFLPFFLLLFVLSLLKASVIAPLTVVVITVGNSAVVIGLWVAHVVWTYFCVGRSKKLGVILKVVSLILLPLPLLLWPLFAILGSLLGGIGYGVFAPLIATFEAHEKDGNNKFYHCIYDGCWSTMEGSLTTVRDFTDFCFHSYFSFMDDLVDKLPADKNPMDIRLSKLPSCLLVSLVGVLVDVLPITAIAVWKSPYMLFRGWKRLLEDLIGREGPFLETVCIPFAGLAIILWPLAVVGAVLASFIASFFLGFYGGVVVYQEESFRLGLAYVVAVISLFDEYVNDLLYLREGTCLPRPEYRRDVNRGLQKDKLGSDDKNVVKIRRESSYIPDLSSQQSRTLKWKIQQYKPMQVWGWLFRSCEVNGRILLREGLIDMKDIEECIVKGNCKKLSIKLPSWSILQCLLTSSKSESCVGLVISDDVELTLTNGPRDRVFEWLIVPLLIMKEQIKGMQVSEEEEMCLRKLVIRGKNENPEDWDETCFPSDDNVRRAQLQAVIRRLQGIVASLSRMPTFRRRFRSLVKTLYVEALHARASDNHVGAVFVTISREGVEGVEGGQNRIARDTPIDHETMVLKLKDLSNLCSK